MGKFKFSPIQAILLISQIVERGLRNQGFKLSSSPGNLIRCALGRFLRILLSALLKNVKNVKVLLL
jgi:hypothetical protein